MSVGIRIEGLERVRRKLDTLLRVDFSELLEVVGTKMEDQTRVRLDETKKAPDGEDWDEWSPAYAASKHGDKGHDPHPGQRTSSQGHTILVLSGSLFDSIQWEVTGDTLELGSNLVYAATHQFGDSDRNIGARPFLGISDEDKDDLEMLIADFFQRRLAAA